MEEKPSIKPEELRVEKLDNRHLYVIDKFKSSNIDLTNFLKEDSLRNERLSINSTYLLFYNPLNELVAFVSLCSDAIKVNNTKLKELFDSEGVDYKTLPAIKICRLSVDKNYEKRGIGAIMVNAIFRMVLEINDKISCRFIYVDSKRESINFYKSKGFEILKNREKGTLPMYYDLIKEIRLWKKTKDELNKLKEQHSE